MEALRQAALAVIAAALIFAIVQPILQGAAAGELLRLIGGIFIAISLLSHIKGIDLQVVTDPFKDASRQARQQTASGITYARQTQEEIIKAECAAYILDKASALGASVTVEIGLSDGDLPIPETVSIRGEVPAEAKKLLSQMLAEEMGIAKEDQIWIG